MTPAPQLYLSVFLLSAGVLGYEVLLTRLFSIIQWHHYAYMIISLALLGFGASGALLSVVGPRLTRRFELFYGGSAALFGVTAVFSFVLAQQVPLNALSLVWDANQVLWLGLIYVILIAPFFFAASCIGLALVHFAERIPLVYGADLMGAGVGSLAVVGLLFVAKAEVGLQLIAVLGLAAALVSVWHLLKPRGQVISLAALVALLAVSVGADGIAVAPSEYKGLTQALRVMGARVVTERSSPLASITVVSNTSVPFRHAPGLSLSAPNGPPEQVAVFIDGDSMSAITKADDEATLGYLDFTTAALPYHLLEQPSVLVLGAGGGGDVLQALHQGAIRVDAVELNRDLVELVRDQFGDYSGHIYDDHRVEVHIGEARAFVSGSDRGFDLIQIALLDSFNASAAGLYALAETNLYTVEAIQAFLERLNPGGYLALTRWEKLPPRDGPKLLATAVAALEQTGGAEPRVRIAWIRGWNTSTLLIKKGEWTVSDSAALRNFCERRSFDVIYYPGISPDEPNRFNVLGRAYFAEAATWLLGQEVEAFIGRYKFDIKPAVDDRPYFFNFFKWGSLRRS